MVFAIVPVCPCTVDLVCQYTFRIMAGTRFEPFHRFYQAGAFIVCFKRYLFDVSVAFTVKAQVKLCSEFNSRSGLSPHDRPDPWLRDAHNTVFYGMYFVIIHIFLLSIQHEDRQVQADLFICHGISTAHKLIQIPDIPSNVTELLTERLPDLLCAVLSAFGVGKVVFSGTPPVPSWQQQIVGSTKTVYDGLQLFPRLVQKGDILRVTGLLPDIREAR